MRHTCNQACVLTTAPEIFCPPDKFCIKFCRNDCSVAEPVPEDEEPCDVFRASSICWKLEFRLLIASVVLLPWEELAEEVWLPAESCCNRFCIFAAMPEPPLPTPEAPLASLSPSRSVPVPVAFWVPLPLWCKAANRLCMND